MKVLVKPCILPAFLKSTENEKDGFTHYLYLAFSNNDNNFFQVSKSSKITNDAESQGASFIFECLKILLELPGKQGPHLVPVDKHAKLTEFLKRLWATLLLRLGIKLTENGLINLHKRVNIETMTLLKNFQSMAHIENTHAKLTEFLKKIAGPSKRLRILLHLDEHRKMFDRNEDNVDEAYKGAMFSKGALQALASVPEVTVIATYTKRPPLPAHASSTVCRYPVTFPCLNVEAAMQEVEELHFPHSQCRFDREQKRLWATLLLRLGIKLTENGLINLHKRVNIETMTLLKNFQSMAHIENTTEALKKCIELCAIKLPEPFSNLNAAKMLVGVKESDMESIERQVSDIVLIDDRVSCSLNCLLTMSDPMYYAYNAGRIRLFQVLMRDDYLSQTPLEAAYSWSICCTSAVVGQLEFLNKSFKIKCENLLPGRLFPQDDSSTYNTKLLKPGIIYIVEERNGHPTHPLADIFFCTELGELVLVDVTGGNDKKVKQKKDRLHRWITREQNKVTDYVLHGVVLAPLATGASMTHGCIQVLCGEDAQKKLGGLRQVFRWLK